MIFHHKQRNIEILIPQLNFTEQIIERVTDFNFLGLTIGQHSTWNGHEQKYQKDIKITRVYVEIKWFFTPKYVENLI